LEKLSKNNDYQYILQNLNVKNFYHLKKWIYI
jgi:hypothetical protein